MALTQSQYDAYLEQAITDFAARKGAKSVAFSDQVVTFASWDEIWAWLAAMKALVSNPSTSRYRLAQTSKGV